MPKEVASYPVLQPPEKKDGKWRKFLGEIVGRVLADGSIENTDYKFREGSIKGGIAVANHHQLKERGDGSLINPATGDVFHKTKKGTGYFCREKKIFVNPYAERQISDE